eukprot:scaffold40796_cov27-Phaeocystis_antarctica.AAC.1
MPSRRCLGSVSSLSSCAARLAAACMTRLTRSMTGSGAAISQSLCSLLPQHPMFLRRRRVRSGTGAQAVAATLRSPRRAKEIAKARNRTVCTSHEPLGRKRCINVA